MGLFRTLCHRALHGTFNGFHRGKKGAKDNFFFYECMLEVKREMYPHTETEFSRRFFQNLWVPHQSRKYGIFNKKKKAENANVVSVPAFLRSAPFHWVSLHQCGSPIWSKLAWLTATNSSSFSVCLNKRCSQRRIEKKKNPDPVCPFGSKLSL